MATVVRRVLCVSAVLSWSFWGGGPVHAQGSAGRTQDAEPVTFGVTVSRDTVTVGDPFTIRVRVRAPANARIAFPSALDTVGRIHARDPRVVITTDSVQWLDQTATYVVAAWDVGAQRAIFDDVEVRWAGPTAGERTIALDGIEVFVRTVLPADSTLHVPRPARPLWGSAPFPWWVVLLAALALALLLWWWRRRARRSPAPVTPALTPYERAVIEFDRLEAMGLVDAGERTRFVTLAVEVMRDYLAARYHDAHLALTSRELLATMRKQSTVATDALQRALHDADLAKFAGLGFTEERARTLAHDARAIVERDHLATTTSAREAA